MKQTPAKPLSERIANARSGRVDAATLKRWHRLAREMEYRLEYRLEHHRRVQAEADKEERINVELTPGTVRSVPVYSQARLLRMAGQQQRSEGVLSS